MHIFKKTVSFALVGVLLASPTLSFALTNKETVSTSIDTLNTSIIESIALKEKTLSDRANELGNRYDTAIRSLGFASDEIEALTSIKKLWVPSFRQDVSKSYIDLKQAMFQDIKAALSDMAKLRDEVMLGYSDLSSAQKQSYDQKIQSMKDTYNVFLSGSTSTTDTFVATFSGRIVPDSELIRQMMKENGKYVLFIRDLRSGYARIDEQKTLLESKKETLEKEVLPKIQGWFLAFTANKKTFTDAIRKDLTAGLDKALLQERIKKQEVELRAYIEDIMSKWNEQLKKNFWQDDELIDATKDLENTITLEKTLHDRIYDASGNINPLDMSGSNMILGNITQINTNMLHSNTILATLITAYSTGNTLSSLNDNLMLSYQTELVKYRANFTKLLEEKLNTALLEEKSHSQTLALIDQEEQILKQNLETATSLDFTKQLIESFTAKIYTLAESDGGMDIKRKTQMLAHRYARTVIQKNIESGAFVMYYGKRTTLDTTLGNLFISLENKSGKAALLTRLPIVSSKINTLLNGSKLSAKNTYTLLVVQSHILKYLEDASK